MTPALSLFLDLTRILAAGAVFLSHSTWSIHTGGLFWQLRGLGREAVDVFFVLSGFVIAHVTTTRESSARDYAVSRIARVASVAVPALIATFALDAIGRASAPVLYHGYCCDIDGPPIEQFLRNLFFVGDVWSFHISPGSNVPWWSLGFEAWYYLAFGLFLFVRRPWNWMMAALALVAAGPGIVALFPIWLAGVFAQRFCRAGGLPVSAARVAFFGGIMSLMLATVFSERHAEIYDTFALTAARLSEYAQDYLIGGLFVFVLVGAHGLSSSLADPLGRIAGPVRWLAGASFAVYLFHMPLLRVTAALSPWPVSSWQTRAMILAGVPLVLLAIAEVTERRKAIWRRAILRLFPSPPVRP